MQDKNTQLIKDYLPQEDWRVNENSNMSYSLQGLSNHIVSETTKEYWLNEIYTEEIRNAHNEGDFHIHDLNLLSVYCVGWDLLDLLLEGFRGVPGKVETRPAKHLRTALGHIVNFLYTLQGEASGAQAFSNFDTLLAPFIRYDKLDYNQVKQALQEFIFNMNVPTRVGFQTPFTNLTLDLTVSPNLKDQPVIIGGKLQKEQYGEFQKEIDMINQAFLEVMLEGDARGRVFTFPIPTYNITKDFNWDHNNMDLLWKAASKYGLPYFSNFINSDMKPEDTRSMCCRLRLDNRKLEMKGGGLFGSQPLTGSIGIVTINLPRIGLESAGEVEYFQRLEQLMQLAKKSLEIKRHILENYTDQGLYPYSKYYLRKMKQRFNSYWKNHFSTIGLVGMNESLMNFMKVDISTKSGNKFAEKILTFMREKLVDFQEETKNNYNLEATPAESTCYRLAKLDEAQYPHPSFANQTEYANGAQPFYTNSTHLPVNYTDDIFETLDLQDNLQTKYTGGTVIHLFIGEQIQDYKTTKALVKKICEKYKLPYFTITPTFSICPNHGYISGEQTVCPQCMAECEVYSRIVGYLRPVRQWNKGKQAEFDIRKTYNYAKESDSYATA